MTHVRQKHHLPAHLAPFVDRDREMSELRRLVLEHRLLTLIGPGGVGKTRLALRLADAVQKRFQDAVWLVELSLLKEPEMLARTVAQALGIVEDGRTDALPQLVAELGSQRALLVLDNCEHLVDGVASLTDRLLQSCPHLTLLATSRERVGIAGELVWRVEPMEVPEAGRRYSTAELERIGAVALFLERARRSSPGFELLSAGVDLVSELVRRLEGLPLAIELAAAWCDVLSPADLLARLSHRFQILTTRQRNMPSRHSSLHAVIDSSYGSLSTRERWLFRRLGLFGGGWSLESMEAVCELGDGDGFDLLARLVDRSLVTVQARAVEHARYRMIDSLREYAVDKLRLAGELEPLRQAFCGYFLRLAETAKQHVYRPIGATWLGVLDTERDNCRAALEMGLAHDAALAIRLAAALAPYWDLRGSYAEGRHRLTVAVQAAPEPTPALAEALRGLGTMAWAQGDQRFATRQVRRALAVDARLGNADGMVRALQQLAQIRFTAGGLAAARARLERAVAIAAGLADQDSLGLCLFRLGLIAMAEDRWQEAEDLLEKSIRLGRAADDAERVAVALTFLGRVHLETDRLEQAEATLRESLAIWRHHGSPRQVARTLESMAALAAERRQHERAAWLAGANAGLLEVAGVKVAQPIDGHLDARVRRSLSTRGAGRALAAGRAADLEAAVRYALGEAERPARPTKARGPDPASAAGLTGRQQVVARLVVEGLTNREIAARLHIAERTAEGHVEQLRNKLSFSSRAQIAAWVAQNLPPSEEPGEG